MQARLTQTKKSSEHQRDGGTRALHHYSIWLIVRKQTTLTQMLSEIYNELVINLTSCVSDRPHLSV